MSKISIIFDIWGKNVTDIYYANPGTDVGKRMKDEAVSVVCG